MKNWILNIVAELLANSLTDEVIEDVAGRAHEVYYDVTDDLLARLEEKAKETDTVIDDLGVKKLRILRDKLVPQCEVD